MISIESGDIAVRVNEMGGSLDSLFLKDRRTEVMGQWPSSQGGMTSGYPMAPVIGCVSKSGRVTYRGALFEPGKHGYARKTRFDIVRKTENSILLRHIHDPEATPGIYPFRHKVEVEYSIDAGTVTSRLSVTNLDERALFFGGGFHPAFAWPLPGNGSQDGHRLTVSHAPLLTVYRPVDGKVYADKTGVSPFDRRTGAWDLAARDFAEDAFFFLPPDGTPLSARVDLCFQGAPDGVALDVSMTGWSGFGVWTKPDGKSKILCIEPLYGVPEIDEDNDVPELDKVRGLRPLLPGQVFTATMDVTPR